MEEKRKQVIDQCRVVAHLANVLSTIHQQYAAIVVDNIKSEDLIDDIGRRTARMMEEFGEWINSMDAVEPKDEWVNRVFLKARDMYPVEVE